MQEVKVLHCKFLDFESKANEMLQQGWNVAGFQPSPGSITGLFIRDVPDPAPNETISTPAVPLTHHVHGFVPIKQINGHAAPDGQTLGERLRWLRGNTRWTLGTIARFAGISLTYLSDLERGRTLPSLAVLYKMAAVFSLTASDLLRGVVLEESDESEAGE